MYKQRLKILLGIIAAIFGIIVLRLGYMQIVMGDYFRMEAEKSLQSVELLPERRGRILDRNNVILAEDRACHDVCLEYAFLVSEPRWVRKQIRAILKEQGLDGTLDGDRQQAEKIFRERSDYTWRMMRQLASELGQNLDERVERIKRNVDRMRETVGRDIREQRMAHVVVPGLDEKTVNSLRGLMASTVGATIVPSHQRYYPHGAMACHIIGVTGPVFREDLDDNLRADEAPWLERIRHNYLPGDVIGKTGVEKMCESLLRPRRGYCRFRRPGEVAEDVPAQVGRDVRLSIDIELQSRLTLLMRNSGQTGCIVVIDVATGDILAMVSWPTYDLNTYRRNYAQLVRDAINLPLHHRAVSSVYAPGSTVKPMTGLAGLGAGVITPSSMITCNGPNPFSRNGKPRCWIYRPSHPGSHGPLNIVGALKNSCNIFFVTVANKLGGQLLADWMGYFGFGELPGTGLPEESSGVIGTPGWLRQHRDRSLLPSDAWNYSIGQGVFAASTLQVANAHATIARGRTFLSPRLQVWPPHDQRKRELPIPDAYAHAVQQGLYAVVNEVGGTAYKVWHNQGMPLDVEICGKTGTAQVPPMRVDSNQDGRITSEDVIVREGDHAWFAGFAPYRHPKIAFTVLAEYAGSGGRSAGPIAKEVVRICQEFGYLKTE